LNSGPKKFVCLKPDCTVLATGICLLGKTEPGECENYTPVDSSAQPESNQSAKSEPSQEGRTFHSGSELGILDILQISRGSYPHVIGLMGSYNAGKTCFLLSLYLMASRQLLPSNYVFRRSLTLQGFEDRARKLREWKAGPLPEKLADHTRLLDDRCPGFLHLGLLRNGKPIDFLLSDLPGEWTSSLVKKAETAPRWEFLRRADGIIIVLDAEELCGLERLVRVTNTVHLLNRLKETLEIPRDMPLVILVAKAYATQMKPPEALREILEAATELGFTPKLVLCASFSPTPKVIPNGAGVVEALELILEGTSQQARVDWDTLRVARNANASSPFRTFRHVE
jgi:hypothetical protein